MKSSTIFLEAAQHIQSDMLKYRAPAGQPLREGCSAMAKVCPSFARSDAVRLFRDLFGQDKLYWWGYECTDEQQEQRILALLFAAEYAKSIGD